MTNAQFRRHKAIQGNRGRTLTPSVSDEQQGADEQHADNEQGEQEIKQEQDSEQDQDSEQEQDNQQKQDKPKKVGSDTSGDEEVADAKSNKSGDDEVTDAESHTSGDEEIAKSQTSVKKVQASNEKVAENGEQHKAQDEQQCAAKDAGQADQKASSCKNTSVVEPSAMSTKRSLSSQNASSQASKKPKKDTTISSQPELQNSKLSSVLWNLNEDTIRTLARTISTKLEPNIAATYRIVIELLNLWKIPDCLARLKSLALELRNKQQNAASMDANNSEVRHQVAVLINDERAILKQDPGEPLKACKAIFEATTINRGTRTIKIVYDEYILETWRHCGHDGATSPSDTFHRHYRNYFQQCSSVGRKVTDLSQGLDLGILKLLPENFSSKNKIRDYTRLELSLINHALQHGLFSRFYIALFEITTKVSDASLEMMN